jgi:predicted metal-binding membrane protein
MQRAAPWPDAWLVPLVTVILIAWAMLAFGSSVLALPVLCSAEGWGAMPLSASFDLARVSNAFWPLALGWALMVVAMMLPLAIAPLHHVRERSFARRQVRATLLFVAGFITLWMMAGLILAVVAWMLRWATPNSLAGIGLSVAIALVWQVSPAKQWCLNRCHQKPPLSAFGLAADLDAARFGAMNGAACAGACWALMLPMLLIGQGQLAAMIAVMLFSIAESLERPAPLAWRWRGGGKALRILAAWWPAIPSNLKLRYLPVFTKSRT